VPGVRHHGVELDVEALGQGDALEVGADAVRELARLLDAHELGGARGLEVAELVEIVRRRRPLRRCDGAGQGKDGGGAA
jgi:hypothetical protein